MNGWIRLLFLKQFSTTGYLIVHYLFCFSTGVTISIMAQVTPSELNASFLNAGLFATLIGTLGRVLSDSMITFSAFLDIHIFIDFVNATFLPLLLLAMGCLLLVYKYYDKLN